MVGALPECGLQLCDAEAGSLRGACPACMLCAHMRIKALTATGDGAQGAARIPGRPMMA